MSLILQVVVVLVTLLVFLGTRCLAEDSTQEAAYTSRGQTRR